jgi:heavy metal translocating P-type ATPase
VTASADMVRTIVPAIRRAVWSLDGALVAVTLGGLAAGLVAMILGYGQLARIIWAAATACALARLVVQVIATLRRGDVGLDLVAALSMTAAIAFGEMLAGNVVALMYAGGEFLESYAEGRARRELTALLGRVARTAMRRVGGTLQEVPIEAIAVGDTVYIRHGEVLPVDGRLVDDSAVIDGSALTGESLPEYKRRGDEVLSGTTSVGPAFDLTVTHPAADSAYSGVVRLVEAAQQSRAPAARMADRYAMAFLVLTLVMAGAAWIFSGDPIRALAVLVVATPCPLILAVPVAIISGISRAARHGVLVKGGRALEALGEARVAVLDKTGTLTHGKAALKEVWQAGTLEADEILRLAASLDQASTHVMAEALIDAAQARSLILSSPSEVEEEAGAGLTGLVDGRRVAIGGTAFVARHLSTPATTAKPGFGAGAATVDVAVAGRLAGVLVLIDDVRPEASAVLARLRQTGVERIVLASGDAPAVAERIGGQLDLDEIRAGLSPQQKVDTVLAERRYGPVMMVGDGVNDAPALAAANVGVAMGARGTAASSEAADVVLLVDRLDRLADGLDIAHRTRGIALQSVIVGLGLSIAAMVAAAFGYLTPLVGALLQEVIDVAVILNALRALGSGRSSAEAPKA